MKAIVIALLSCLTALGCALILSNRLPQDIGNSVRQNEHYTVAQFEKELGVKSIFKIETKSGRTWRLKRGSLELKKGPPVEVEGWTEIPQSFAAAFAKTVIRFGTPSPSAGDSQPITSPEPEGH